jgi:flagellin
MNRGSIWMTISSIQQNFTAKLGVAYPTARQSPLDPANPIVPRTDPQKRSTVSLALGATWSTTTYNSIRDAFDHLNVLQVAEFGVDRVSYKVNQLHELASESASSEATAAERSDLDGDYSKLLLDIDEIVRKTTYREQKVLDGSMTDAGGRGLQNLYTEALGLRDGNVDDIVSSEKAELVVDTLENKAQRDIERSRDWLREEKAAVQEQIRKLQEEMGEVKENSILSQQVAFESTSFLKDQLVNQFSVAVPMQADKISSNAPSLIQQAEAAVSTTSRSAGSTSSFAAYPGPSSTTPSVEERESEPSMEMDSVVS